MWGRPKLMPSPRSACHFVRQGEPYRIQIMILISLDPFQGYHPADMGLSPLRHKVAPDIEAEPDGIISFHCVAGTRHLARLEKVVCRSSQVPCHAWAIEGDERVV